MKSLAKSALFTGAALLVGGCASPAPSASRHPASAAYADFGYAWSDPFFYAPWYDPATIVLPPPLPGAPQSGIRRVPAGPVSSAVKEAAY